MHPFRTLDRIHEQLSVGRGNEEPGGTALRWSPPWLKCSPGSDRLVLDIDRDRVDTPVRVYTGEPIRTQLAAQRILELETARLLLALGTDRPAVLAWIDQLHERCLHQCYATRGCVIGECSLAAVAFIRYLTVCPRDASHQVVAHQVQRLRQLRDGRGRWSRLPYYYTLLALVECAPRCPAAREEIRYARHGCRLADGRIRIAQPYRGRREAVLRAALGFDPVTESGHA